MRILANGLSLAVAEMYGLVGMSAPYAEFVQANEAILVERPDHFVLPVIQGLTCDKVIGALAARHASNFILLPNQYRSNNLDLAVTKNDRDPSGGSYVALFDSDPLADCDLMGLSVEMLKEKGVKGIGLLECLSLALCHLIATGEPIDEEMFVACAGSRFSNGKVPLVFYVHKKLCVDGDFTTQDKGPSIGTRRVEMIELSAPVRPMAPAAPVGGVTILS